MRKGRGADWEHRQRSRTISSSQPLLNSLVIAGLPFRPLDRFREPINQRLSARKHECFLPLFTSFYADLARGGKQMSGQLARAKEGGGCRFRGN